jgi:hypothetical protein
MSFVPTIPAADVFAPTTAGGDPRGANMAEAQTWGTEVEAALAAISNGIEIRLPHVNLCTTANVTLSGEQTIDGTLTSTTRILVAYQTDTSQNGVYVTGAGAWTRATDADTRAELYRAAVFVLGGTVNGNNTFFCSIAATGTLGSIACPWVLLDRSAGLAALTAAVDALEARMDTAEADITALEAADTALDTRIDTAESEIDALQAADTALDERLDDLEVGSGNSVRHQITHRPGDVPSLFTLALTGGDEDSLTPWTDVGVGGQGKTAAITGAGIIAQRGYFAAEAARPMRVRFAVKRVGATTDPAGQAVRLGVAWYDASRVYVSSSTFQTLDAELVTGTRIAEEFTLARESGYDVTVPAGAWYGRAYAQQFSGEAITQFEVIDVEPITTSQEEVIIAELEALAVDVAADAAAAAADRALAQAAATEAEDAAASLDPAELKTKLSANRTYYIRSTAAGNAGTGLTNLDADAFLSLTNLWTYLVKTVNANGYTISIKGTGTFTGAYILNGWIEGTTPGTVILEAESGVNTDLLFDTTSGITITAQYGAHITFQNFSAESNSIIFTTIHDAKTHFGTGMRYGASGAGTAKIYTTRFGYSQVVLDCEIYGGGGSWMQSDHDGHIRGNFGTNGTLFTGSPTFTTLFSLDLGEITLTGTLPSPVWDGACGGGLAVTGLGKRSAFQWASGGPFEWPTGIAGIALREGAQAIDGLAINGASVFEYATGTAAAPSEILQRKGNADAAIIAQRVYYGDNSSGTPTILATESVAILDWTAGSEDTQYVQRTMVAGALTTQVATKDGVILGNPTGGFKGTGTLNATAVYDDNTLLTDLVLDMKVDGSFDVAKYAAHPIASEMGSWWFDLDTYAGYWRTNRCLPGMRSWVNEANKPSTGELITRLTAVVETMAAHIEQLHLRIKALEA